MGGLKIDEQIWKDILKQVDLNEDGKFSK